jgi:hypothetical protein
MATTTPNFGWAVPTSTDLVKDGAVAIETLGDSIDASLLDLKGGTTGQVLAKASGTDMDFSWVAIDPLVILDAKGDLITATAADTPARLAVGTNGQTLVADSTASTGLKWATPATAGFKGVAVQNTSTPSIANDTFTAVTMGAELFDTDAFHSTSTNTSRITIPTGLGGYYWVYGAVRYGSNAAVARRQVAIYKNGAQLADGYSINSILGGNVNLTPYTGVIVNLAANDYVELFTYQDSGGSLSLAAVGNYFGAYYLGA